MIDAGDHEVGLFVEQAGDGQVHAIRRRAIDFEAPLPVAGHTQRPRQRQGVAGRGTVPVGGNHGHVGDLLERIDQCVDARGEISVVVTYEDFHSLFRRAGS